MCFAHAQTVLLFCLLLRGFEAQIKLLNCLKLMQAVLAHEVLKCLSVKWSPLELNTLRFLKCYKFITYRLNCTVASAFVPYLTVLINWWQSLKEIGSFSIYDELIFLWIFHCKQSLDWKCQNLALSLQPWYTDQKWLLHWMFVNIGPLVSDLRSRWHYLRTRSMCASVIPFIPLLNDQNQLSILVN